MTVRTRVLVAVTLLGAVVLLAAARPEYANPARHFVRNALRALF